jgi:hypothetical protein
MEAEVRALLAQACGADEEAAADPARSLPEWVDGLYGKRHPRGVVADLLRQRRREGRRE